MKSRLSALMDGELEVHELVPVLDALARTESLRDEWSHYQVIGDALRQEPELGIDLSAGVMAALQNEPTVLAPANHVDRSLVSDDRQWRGMMAMAASIAGVATVAWMAFSQAPLAPSQAESSRVALRQAPVLPVAMAKPPSGRMQEYLVAHQTYSPGGQMQSGTRYIRTVSAGR